MSLSSGGWTHVPPPPPAVLGDEGTQRGCSTVLMSVKVSVRHSGTQTPCVPGTRPLCLPDRDRCVRLQLSMDPGKAGEFRLALRDGGVSIAEFDLRTVHYEVKTPCCHQLSMTTPPQDKITFNFRCEQEAQAWATVVTSSVREAQRVATDSSTDDGQLPAPPVDSQSHAPLPSTEELCVRLVRAIGAGDARAASVCAVSLARQQTALCIQPSQKHYSNTAISLAVVVEDASSSCCVTVKVFPHTTVAALKQQVFGEYGFPPRLQRWLIAECLCADSRTLASYGIQRDGDTAFLYLVSAQQVWQQDQETALHTPTATPTASPALNLHTQGTQPVANGPDAHGRVYRTLPPRLHPGSSVSEAERFSLEQIQDLINRVTPQLSDPLDTQLGWACPSCTYINKPTRPGCEMCSAGRPDGYMVPGSYRPDTHELHRIHQEKEAIRQYQQEKGRREELRATSSLQYNLNQDY